MRFRKVLVCAIGILALALTATAQVPTGTLSGRVTDGAAPLPGVSVTVASPNLQGTRMAVTSTTGDYIFAFLPPGDYTVRFELQGFQTLETTVKISAAQTSRLDAEMPMAQLAEEITVTGSADTISTNTQIASTMDSGLMDQLPVARNLVAAAALTPGVASTGPNGALAISGALSYDNLYMVNGVVITDNVRGTPNTLYIEDAIQETTTQVGGVSAEFGRFAGGVINTITKSGGNELSGSLRVSFDNASWRAKTPLSVEPVDKTNETYELTLGGYILKDKLWFFGAGRSRKIDGTGQTSITNLPFATSDDEKRYEGKLTWAITQNHRIIGSYMKIDRTQTNNVFGTILDYNSLDKSRDLPQELRAANYTGVITDTFFVEAQYSKRRFTFEGSGGDYTDLINGTVVRDNTHYYRWNSPTFCGVCGAERRDNEDYLAKGSWFLSTDSLGTHDIVFGYDSFDDMRKSNNYQSGSNFVYWPTDLVINADGTVPLDPNGSPFPIVYGDGSSDFTFWPILESSKGTRFRTKSTYINDRWRLSNRLSFNVGVRYDKNDGEDASHHTVAKDSRISPRLGVSYDLRGDGDFILNASYGQYVTAIAGSVADQGGGSPSQLGYFYYGPDINTGSGPYLTTHEVLQSVFDWLYANGSNAFGAPNRDVGYGYISGLSRVVGKDLKSPYSDEFTVGVSKRLGTHGTARIDYIHREFKDLYSVMVNQNTGQVTDELGNVSDLQVIVNDNTLKKKYDGVNLQAQYRTDRWNFGGNYTWSHAYGNYEGETAGSGPIANSSNPYYYPEYSQQRWTNPRGDLSIDQRHRGRVWAVWDVLNTKHNRLSLSFMESYFSGSPYSATGSVYSYPYVTNPGYAQRPTTVTYYFSQRGAYHTDNITRSDLSLNYSFLVPALGKDLEFFVQPEVINLFNEQGVTSVDATVYTRYNTSNLPLFDPFNAAPLECPQGTALADCKAMGANWQKGPNFGKATLPGDYQQPRTFQVSVGVRF